MLMLEKWPKYDDSLAKDDLIQMPVQVCGKHRGTIQVPVDITKAEALDLARREQNVAKFILGKKIVKEIFVPGRIVNIVVRDGS